MIQHNLMALTGSPNTNMLANIPNRLRADQLDTVSHFPVDIGEGRSLSNVLKRISNLVALKNTGLQSYKNTDFKQYWMPDSVSKECYDCGEKFTTFRRRHHCRVCGQIFCSRCCNQEIPGKIMGCTGYTNRCLADIELGLGHDQMSEKVTFCTVGTTLFPFRRVVDGISPGDLRVCTYCCKIVLSYLQSADVGADLTADLRAVQEDLQIKFGNPVSSLAQNNTSSSGGNLSDNQDSSSLRRKTSVGYQEDRFALGRAQSAAYLSMEERCRVLQMSASLRALFDDLCRPNLGLILQTHRYRLRNYHNCFLGTELVDWLIAQYHASTRVNPMDLPDEISEEVIELQNNSNFRDSFESSVNMEEFEQGTAIGQALLVAGYLESITMSEQSFNDGYSLYRPLLDLSPTQPTLSSSDLEESRRSSQDAQEPLWVKQIPQDDFSTKDSESEGVSMEREDSSSLPSSGSMFYLDLNVEANTAHLIRPNKAADNEIDSASGAGSKQTEITGNAGVSSPLQDNSHSGISSEFLSGAVLSQSREMRPSKGWHKVSQLRTDNGELGAYNALCEDYSINAFTQHESSLLKQLLNAEGLAQSWADIMLPLAEQIVDVVCPDVKNEVDDMDIRQYVQFKKVPGGSRESRIVSGVVCTKNVAHRAMATRLVNPRILLLGCSIAYQRVEGKLLSLEPVMMQEYEYLRNVVARIAKLQPNLVLVQRNVSRLAQEFLLGLQVTLVLNIKASVLERVSRCTQADIVTSVDAHIGASKTLMFFEGCISPHLGCTVLLRGASNTELAKLKRVATRMIFIEYSWRLENKEKSSLSEEKRMNVESVSDFSDPLHLYLSLDDDVFSTGQQNGQQLSVAELPLSNHFRKALDDTILSASPFLKGIYVQLENGRGVESEKYPTKKVLYRWPLECQVPYLETEAGRNCALRRFFPDEIFWSAQFNSSSDTNTNSRANNGMEMAMQPDNKLLPRHEFVSAKITSSADSKEVQTLLAHFRACGSRLCPSEPCTESPLPKGSTEQPGKLQATPWPDALDLARHQRLAVLFCSYSQESSNFPAFCVNPIFYMDFYGHYDIPLGSFLERYCFSKSYMCPSTSCDTPMMHHIRRFVHNSGCVYLMLKELDSNLIDSADDKHILMWNWCSKCKSTIPPLSSELTRMNKSAVSLPSLTPSLGGCRTLSYISSPPSTTHNFHSATGTPLVEMSEDTWALSFAKYLELRFHGHMYTRREHDNTCNHSLHHDHFQYFSMKNIVVSFKYTSVVVWEVSLPPPVIILKYDPQHQNNIIDDLKKLALKGYEVYSGILDKLCSLETDLEGLATMKQQLQKEQNNLKTCIDEVQLQLTSPTLESKKLQGVDGEQDVQLLMWRIEDSVVHLKQLIAEGFTSWNSRIQDIAIHSKKKNNDNMKPVSLNTSLPETEGCNELQVDVISNGSTLTNTRDEDVTSYKLTLYQMGQHSPTPVMRM
uniref:1-phosphatidylinositol-3-phosphate 5-kinase n=1 Tax=Timema poppense TaxID=170557 RepID=A0A7R9CKI7_TIMPO|nr:unnamed protein product [Timema poppensis]